MAYVQRRTLLSDVDVETYHPRKRTWALVFLVSAVFFGIGFLIISDPGASSDRFWAHVCSAFFGLCALVSLIQFVPGSSFLRLTPEGLTVRTMWRSQFYRWSDIERFGVAEFGGGFGKRHRMVGLELSTSHSPSGKAQTLMSINRSLTGFGGALPDNYGWDYAELAAHLNTLRARYVGSSKDG